MNINRISRLARTPGRFVQSLTMVTLLATGGLTASAQTYQQEGLFPLTAGSYWMQDNGHVATVVSATDSGGTLSVLITNWNSLGQPIIGYLRLVADATEVRGAAYSNPDHIIVDDDMGYYPFLQRPMTLGRTWNSQWNSNGYPIYQTAVVTATNLNLVIGGAAYGGCTELTVTSSYPNGYTPGQVKWVNSRYYFLPDVGCVRRILTSDLGQSQTNSVVAWNVNGFSSRPIGFAIMPVSQTAAAGGVTTFSASAFGLYPLKFQWRKNVTNLVNGGRITGATSTNLSIAGAQAADGGSYYAVVTNAYGSVTSAVAVLTVVTPPSSFVLAEYYYPLVAGNEWRFSGTDYDTSPARRIVRVDNVSFPVTSYMNCSSPQPYTTNLVRLYEAYAFPNTLTSYDDWYEYVGNQQGILSYWGNDDGGESLRGNGGLLFPHSLKLGQTSPAITREFFDAGVCQGAVSFKVTAVSWGSVTVPAGTFNDCLKVRYTFTTGGETSSHEEWWARGVGMVKHRNVPDDGADSLDLEFYQVVGPALITKQPISQTNSLGATASFSVTVMGTPPPTYQWKRNNVNLTNSAHISGATTSNLMIHGLTFSDGGQYTVSVANTNNTVLSAPAALTVRDGLNPVLSVTSHTNLQLLASASATISGTATDAGFGENGISSVTINGALASNDTASGSESANWSRDQPLKSGANALTIVATDGQGNKTTTLLNLVSDTTRPTVAFTSPVSGLKVFNPALDVTGKASDGLRVAAVFIQHNGGTWTQASGTTNWSTALVLEPGPNTVKAYSVDIAGNFSLTNGITVTYGVLQPLTLAVEGSGSILGATNGQLLEIGKEYKLTAKAATRNFHVGWSGSINSTSSIIPFLMHTNASFTSHFVTNPFVGLQGKYYGLFAEEAAERNQDRSGAFSLVVTEPGVYTASLQVGAKKYPGKGKFDWLGRSQFLIKPSVSSTVTVILQMDVTNSTDVVDGVVSGSGWESPLTGGRARAYPKGSSSPFAGKYTMVVPGSDNAVTYPGGEGYGLLSITPAGVLKLAGKLADGTAWSQSSPVLPDGWWPLYVALYTGKGSTHGWLQFTNNGDADLGGSLSWIKQTNGASKYYPPGFTNEYEVVGSLYVSPGTNRIVTITNGTLSFLHGNLIAPITNSVLLTSNNKITNLSSNKLTMTFTTSSGLFAGSVTDTNTSKLLPFSGVVLQKLDSGYGYFLGTNQSGRVMLQPLP